MKVNNDSSCQVLQLSDGHHDAVYTQTETQWHTCIHRIPTCTQYFFLLTYFEKSWMTMCVCLFQSHPGL